jgi:hypothetical protein
MAHFAKIDSLTNIVIDVNAVNNEDIQNLEFPDSEPVGIEFLLPWSTEGTYWKQTSYNSKFRKNYASAGYIYSLTLDGFIVPKSFSSWVLNEETCRYEPPIPCPQDENSYWWSEEQLKWVKND